MMSDDLYGPLIRPTPDEPPQTLDGAEDRCAVLLHNDDVTPYDYVIQILGTFFLLSEEIADHVAWTAHTKGSAVVIVCTRAEAEKLALAARGRAQREGYPLTFTLELA